MDMLPHIRRLLLIAALVGAGGCSRQDLEQARSQGTCTGMLRGTPVTGALGWSSYFARDDQNYGIEHAFVNLTINEDRDGDGVTVMKIDGHLRDMPTVDELGAHRLPSEIDPSGYVDIWDIVLPDDAILASGTLTITRANNTQLGGAVVMQLTDGSAVECTFVLIRNPLFDTDD